MAGQSVGHQKCPEVCPACVSEVSPPVPKVSHCGTGGAVGMSGVSCWSGGTAGGYSSIW